MKMPKLFYQAKQQIVTYLSDTSHRYTIVGYILGLILVGLVVKMVLFIQSEEAERWKEIGSRINPKKSKDILPLRGTIYASDGRPVAITAPVYKLYIDYKARELELLHRPAKDSIEQRKKETISKRFSEDLDTLALLIDSSFRERGIIVDRKKLRERWRKDFNAQKRHALLISNEVSYSQFQWLRQQSPLQPRTIEKNGKKQTLSSLIGPAIIKEERSKRINPFGSLAKRTIGSVYGKMEDSRSQGKQGIERSFDSVLSGKPGEQIEIFAPKLKAILTKRSAKDGYDVYTTLNMDMQSQLERIMRNRLEYFKAVSGTAILLEVSSGKVLAITNLKRVSENNYVESENFAVSDLSEPGSTFKVASMLVALNNNMVNPEDSIDVGNGIWQVGGQNVRDHNAHHGGYGRLSISQVIENSSNVGIAKIIQRNFGSNPTSYVKQVRDLAFGYDLRLEIEGSATPRIRMPNDRWSKTTLAWMSFGYETQIPPLYTAAFFNAIANDGKLMKPYLVEEIRDRKNQLINRYEPTIIKEQIASLKSIAQIQTMLRRVVTHGTGKKSINSNVVEISGKSGTAQIAKGGSYKANGRSHQVSFCGYFPSASPRYTLMVVIREPSKEFPAGGGSMAGPVVKELAEAITAMETPSNLDSLFKLAPKTKVSYNSFGKKNALMQLMQETNKPYKPDVKISQDSYIRIDSLGREHAISLAPRGQVPNVVGMSAQDANYLLLRSGYTPILNGYGIVKSQSPSAGTKASRGKDVTLLLGY